MKIEVGKKYRTRDGSLIFGPMNENDDPDFPFWGDSNGRLSNFTFAEDGTWLGEGSESDMDLVEEVIDDRADNPGPAVVHGHDTPACHRHDDGAGCVGLETPVLEQ